jgi:hypothetical protein
MRRVLLGSLLVAGVLATLDLKLAEVLYERTTPAQGQS